MRKRKPAILNWFAVAVVAVIAIGVACYTDTHNAQISQRVTLATTRQPEPVTELYFASPTQLVKTAKAGQSVPVRFVVHNQESRDMDYHYTVTFSEQDGTTTTFADTTIRVGDGATQEITQNITVPAGTGRGAVGVQLVNKSQALRYWLERS